MKKGKKLAKSLAERQDNFERTKNTKGRKKPGSNNAHKQK